MLVQSLYSRDLALCDIFMLTKLEIFMTETRFHDVKIEMTMTKKAIKMAVTKKAIEMVVTKKLHAIPEKSRKQKRHD